MLAAVTKGEDIDLDRVTFGLGEAIEPILRGIYERFAKRAWNDIAEETGRVQRAKQEFTGVSAEITVLGEAAEPIGFTQIVNPLIEEALQKQVIEISISTSNTTATAIETALQQVRDELAEGATRGESIRLLTQRVQEVFERAPVWKARQIAITESSRAVADAGIISANQTGVIQGFRFVPSADACELCQVYSANNVATGVPLVPFTNGVDAQAQVGQFKDRTMAPIHPNCRCINVPILDIDPAPDRISMQRNIQFGEKPRN